MFGKIAAWAGLCAFAAVCAAGQSRSSQLRGQVSDEDGKPVDGVEIQLAPASGAPFVAYSDATGYFEIDAVPAGSALVSLSKPGFFQVEKRSLEISSGANDVIFTINHETEVHQQVQVSANGPQIQPDTTTRDVQLLQHDILNVPVPSTHDLTHSLAIMPGVVADASSTLHYAGARVSETEVLLDGFEIGDPTDGQLTTRVNVDAVQSAVVESGDTDAAYAHAGAGVLSLSTITGDDRWRFGTTDFIPAPIVQQGLHLGSWYPRFTLSGPIEKKKAWFSEALSLWRVFDVISGLQPGQNYSTAWYGDSLTRIQVNLTPGNVLSANFLYNQSYQSDVGLAALTPYSATTRIPARRWFTSVRDQIWFHRTLVQFGVAADSGLDDSYPQGTGAYIVTPSSNTGNYFQQLEQRGRRLQVLGNLTTTDHRFLGRHTISAGGNVAAINYSQSAVRSAIDFGRSDGSLSEVATFSGQSAYRLTNTQAGGYVQDLWQIAKAFELAIGVRGDWDRLIQHGFVGPRVAANLFPLGEGRAKLTISWGLYTAALDLNTLGRGFDQQRTDVFYDATGTMPLPNPIVTSFFAPRTGLEQPWFSKTSVEWQEQVGHNTSFGASFLLRREGDGLAYQNLTDPATELSLIAENNRHDRYVAGEFWIRHRFGENAEISFDYTRSRATTNEAVDYTLGSIMFAAQSPGPLPWDVPNRIVSDGWTPLPFWHLMLSYFVEYHTGLPFSVIDQERQLIGAPDGSRYPSYFDLNVGLEKRFHFRRKEYAFRVAVENATGHLNPNQVVNNVDAANFLAFSGGPGRAFTARLRFVGSN